MSRAKVRGSGDLKRDTWIVEMWQADQKAERVRVAMTRREIEAAKPTVEVPADAVQVRVRHLGWFRVKRVNATTVTVVVASNEHTGAEATARYPLVDVVAVAR